jgi:cell wall-active antibiotic response 4TMS protein YvqF
MGMRMTSLDGRTPEWTGILVGLTIVGFGLILLFDQAGLFGWQPSWSVWPFLIIGAGLARFATPRPDGSREGTWLIFIGVWLLLNEMRVLRFRDSWPLILVALGVHTMWKALRPAQARRSRAGQTS